tara:strand:- start:1277 stop:2056 length:780 start_codon:yes stop_codon:yes gene_type:complete
VKKSPAEQVRLLVKKMRQIFAIPFYFGHSFIKNVYIAYQPDSYASFNQNSDFKTLFRSFIKYNKLNNSGDIPRLWLFIMNIQKIIDDGIEGDFAEVGVWRGNTASILAHYAFRNQRKVYLFDTYQGFDKSDLKGIDADQSVLFENTSIELVANVLGDTKDVCEFVKGYFPDSISQEHRSKKYAVVSLDCDLYEPMAEGLNFFYPLMPEGGLFLLHDYHSLHWPGTKKAVDEFVAATGEFLILIPDKSGSAVIRKSSSSI